MRYLLLSVILVLGFQTQAQDRIKPVKGYSPHIGVTVAMLEDLRKRVSRSVVGLNQAETDFLLDDEANRIGAMILHLAATERYYQFATFPDQVEEGDADRAPWGVALELGDPAREQLVGKPISYYLDVWEEVRAKTLALLKTKDDVWFNAKLKTMGMNNHWAWYHVMEHQANHMGQIRMIAKRAG